MKLTDLPGVGSRMRERLIEQYGDEEKALQAVLEGDVSGLVRALSERQALLLVQHMRALNHGARPDQFAATDEAARISRQLLSKMAEYAHSDYARMKIGTLFASSSPALLAESRSMAEQSILAAEKLFGRGLDEMLKRVRPLREPSAGRIRDRAVAAASPEDFQSLKARGLDRLIDLHLAEGAAEMADLARGYSQISLVGAERLPFRGWEDLEGVEAARSLEEWYLVPESVLAYFKENATEVNLKYIDPSYIIRSVPANSQDAWLCDGFARNAVHAAMAGKTDLIIGYWHGVFVHVPIPAAVSSRKKVNPESELWKAVISATGQPHQWI